MEATKSWTPMTALMGDECTCSECAQEICEECEQLEEDCECEEESALYNGRVVVIKYPEKQYDTVLSAL